MERTSHVIVCSVSALSRSLPAGHIRPAGAVAWDEDSVFHITFDERPSVLDAVGRVVVRDGNDAVTPLSREPNERFQLLVRTNGCHGDFEGAQGFVWIENGWQPARVILVPHTEGLFSRFGGIIETDALENRNVCIVGLGSVGSGIAVELAKAGVGGFRLLDDDRLEPGNLSRHISPLSHVGRYKTRSVRDLILEKNPSARVDTLELRLSWKCVDALYELVQDCAIVVGSVDNHEARLVLNRVCLDEGKQLLLPGLRRRAYAAQILSVHPGEGPCYGCLTTMSPGEVRGGEVSNERQVSEVAYSDRAVAVEPGLSNDVAPVVTMTTKLVIQKLLEDRETSLRSLDEDLIAPYYLWLNRREGGTPFEALSPMGFGVEAMSILRWYGLPFERLESCPLCGQPGAWDTS